MLHHLVNFQAQPKVCAIATQCNFVGCVKMANQLQSRAIQTKTRSDNSGQVRVEGVEVLVSRVPGELADSDEQAARQLHWPAAHTRIPFHTLTDFSCQIVYTTCQGMELLAQKRVAIKCI